MALGQSSLIFSPIYVPSLSAAKTYTFHSVVSGWWTQLWVINSVQAQVQCTLWKLSPHYCILAHSGK